jgi:hypothetical protein
VRLPPTFQVTPVAPAPERGFEDFTPAVVAGELTLPIHGARGTLTARDGVIVLERLELPLGDLRIQGANLPARGVELRALELATIGRTSATVVRREADVLSVRGDAAMELRWKLVLDDGTLYSLGPLELPRVQLNAALTRAGSVARFEVMMLCPGVCAEIPAVIQLRDAALDVVATAATEAL